jgi:hypothetical protein
MNVDGGNISFRWNKKVLHHSRKEFGTAVCTLYCTFCTLREQGRYRGGAAVTEQCSVIAAPPRYLPFVQPDR